MLAAALVFLVAIVVFTLLFRWMVQVAGKRAGQVVERRHRAAETILNEERVPAEWAEDVRRRGLTDRAGVRRLLRRLQGLAKYFESSPLVEGEESRRLILKQLESTAERWRESSLEQLLRDAEGASEDGPR